MSKKIGVGIIGTGVISNLHMKAYLKTGLVEPVAVYDINRERAEEFAKQHGVKNVCSSHEELLALTDVEAVSICTLNKTHAPLSIAAINAGKHVLCEKPPAINLSEMLEVEEAVKNSNKIYMAGFLRRFLQKGVILKSFVESGKLGEVFYGEACFRRRVGNPGGWFANKALSGGGPLIDIGVHIIDLAIYLMGKPKAVAVSAATFNKIGGRNNIKMIERYRPREYDDYCDVEDSVFALIRFDNGSILQCKCSFSEHVKNNYMNIELQGSKGGATFEPKLEIYTEENDYLTDITPVYTEYTEPLQYMMDQEISHFIKCINGEAECISPIGDAVQMMRIIDAIYKSAELKREVEI